MLLDHVGKPDKQWLWFPFHIGLGIIATMNRWPVIFWVYLISAVSFASLFLTRNRKGTVHAYLVYFVGLELLARMAKCSPLVPHEAGKYLMFLMLLIGLLVDLKGIKSIIGLIIIGLSLPSIAVMPTERILEDIVFNSLGIINLGMAVLYFYHRPFTFKELEKTGRLILLPIVSVVSYVVIETPNFSEIEFTLGANFDTSGGFGSNQVSTLLGLGFAVIALMSLLRIRLVPVFPGADLVVFGFIFFRGLITFSRGGVLGGALSVIFAFGFYTLMGRYPFPKIKLTGVIVGVGFLAAVAVFANQMTGNMLLLRYKGESASSLAGDKKKDLSQFTTGRSSLMEEDLLIWQDHPILGVGPGGAPKLRYKLFGNPYTNHTEFTRLLSEHGIFGLVINGILFLLPVFMLLLANNDTERFLMIAFFTIALFSAVHNGTRTVITPVLYGLATIAVAYPRPEDELPEIPPPDEADT